MKQRISMGSTSQALVISSLDFDEDGFLKGQKVGLLPFDPDHDPAEMLEKASKFKWDIYGLKNLNGFQAVKKQRPLTDEELAAQQVASSGRTILTEFPGEDALIPFKTIVVGQQTTQPNTNTGARVNTDPLIAV